MAKYTGTNGNDLLTDTKFQSDLMFGLLGDDTLDGVAGRDTLDGGGGNDSLLGGSSSDSLIGGEGADTLDGGTFQDTLLGGKGNDSLLGGAGSDSLDGGLGNDTMNGGAGVDYYVVDSSLDSANDSGTELGDTVRATVSVNLATGPFAGIEHVTLLGTAAIDATGNGIGNRLTGNSGANKLDGGAGWDTLEGGAGADTLTGGTGNDTYIIDALDSVNESGGDANDRVRGAFAIDLANAKLAGIEHATLTGLAALAISGNGGNNMLIGNGGANTLTGGGGTDTLIGGGGNDVYNFEAGDVIIEYFGGGADLVISDAAVDLAGLAIENLQLTGATAVTGSGNEFNNKITANSGTTSLFGQDGNDTLFGAAGVNSLDGGAGADVMAGGDGSDTYFVDSTGDKVSETGTTDSAFDQVKSSVNYILGANVERLTLIGTGDLSGTGNALANTINGNTGNNTIDGAAGNDNVFGDLGNDLLQGGAGDDTVDGFFGNDLLVGGASNDTLNLAEDFDTLIGGAGIDTFNVRFADANRDVIADFDGNPGGDVLDLSILLSGYAPGVSNPADFIQTVVVGGSTQLNIDADGATGGIAYTLTAATLLGVSTDLAGLIANGVIALPGGAPASTAPTFGTAAGDSLAGAGTSNYTDGKAGNDSLSGGGGNDTLIGGAGADKMDGGAGDDTFGVDSALDVVFDGGGTSGDHILASISIDLSKYTGIEHATLSGKANLNLTGDGGANLLIGNDGANILKGAAADDALDTLAGGAGNDKYYIDGGVNDLIIEFAGGGTDEVVQLAGAYGMTDYVENLTVAAGSFATKSTGNGLDNKMLGNDGANTLEGGGGRDLLTGGKGDDSLDGGDGKDTLSGGDGGDTLSGDAGADSMSGGAGDDAYIVDDAGDKIADSGGIDSVLSLVSYVLGAGLENLSVFGDIGGTGNSLANKIAGGNGENLLLGLGGNDSISGGNDNDTLVGGDGDDTLNGGLDHDLLLGGAGKDRFIVDKHFVNSDTVGDLEISPFGGDIVDLNALLPDVIPGGSSITDYIRVKAENGSTMIEIDLDGKAAGEDFREAVTLVGVVTDLAGLSRGGFADLGPIGGAAEIDIGTAGKDTFGTAFGGIGFGAAGNDSITGGGGAEWLDGGTGADTLRGSNGDDTYVIDSLLDVILEETALDDNDMVRGSISIDLRDDSRFINIEHAVLTGKAALKLNGDEQDNYLGGNAGNNTIDGGSGSDTMAGGAGNDAYYVVGSDDTVIEYQGGGTDSVFSVGDFTLDDQVENLTLLGSLSYDGVGNDLANKIAGNSGSNKLDGLGGNDSLSGGDGWDTLDGGAGADTMNGGNGFDTYIVDNIGDRIVETGTIDSTSDQVQSYIDYTLGNGLESLLLLGTGDLQGTGNSARNIMFGNSGDNTLSGLAGDDGLVGDDGDDLLLGGDGKDGLNFSNGADTLIGGAGADRFQLGISTLAPGDAADLIADFETGAGGDVINLQDFFGDPTVAADVLANPGNYIQTETVNGNTILRLDLDGTGAAETFFDLCVLQGVSTDLNGLIGQGNLITASPEILIPI
ncbi:MAG: beta strand repeat-containing protein [Dongiaceae bacterium]